MIAGWNPQLVVDSHEMGSTTRYLLLAAAPSVQPAPSPSQHKWCEALRRRSGRALDARGYSYYTREWNEEFFPGYGSSWASYLGAIGILYEMSGTDGTLVRQRAGTLRTYAAGRRASGHQLGRQPDHAGERPCRDARRFVTGAASAWKASDGAVGAWLLPEGRHPERVADLVACCAAGHRGARSHDDAAAGLGPARLRTGAEVGG